MRLKISVVAAVAAALASASLAQAEMFEVSPVVGLTLTSVSNDPDLPAGTESKMGAGFAVGALGDWTFYPDFALELGVLYGKRKTKTEATSGGVTGTSTASFNQLQLPLLVRYTGLPYVSFGVGPYMTLGLGDISSTTQIGTGAETESTSSYDPNVSKTDFGLVGDVRGTLPIVPGIAAMLDVRYMLGLKNQIATPNTTASQKLRGFEFLAGATFGF